MMRQNLARRRGSISSLHLYPRRHIYQARRGSLVAELASPHGFRFPTRCLPSTGYRLSTLGLIRKFLPHVWKNQLDTRPQGDPERPRGQCAAGPQEEILSEEQLRALRLAEEGENLFITGRAGTGKSVMIKRIIAQALERDPKRVIAVTAPTGTAAALVGGRTIHSWAGIGNAEKCRNFYLERARFGVKWFNAGILIIDEISMVPCAFSTPPCVYMHRVSGRVD